MGLDSDYGIHELEQFLRELGGMMETFIQIDCIGKGSEVEVIKEHGSMVTVRNIKTNFIYFISLRNFQKHYEAKDDGSKSLDSSGGEHAKN